MFKRPRLRATSPLVNASSALVLLFLVSACGGPSDAPVDSGESEAETPAAALPSRPEGLSLPAVWSTSPLDSPITSVGVAGGLGSTIAVTYETGELQLFDFDAERLTDKAALDVRAVGNGRYLLLSGTPVTLFPGINRSGGMTAYIHGGSLTEPLPLDLKTEEIGIAAGLCSGDPEVEADGVLRLAFWTQEEPNLLYSGRVVEVGDNLAYLLDEPVEADRAITACIMEGTGATVFSAPTQNVTVLDRSGKRNTLTLDTSGNYSRLNEDGAAEPFTIREGISVKVPAVPTAMAGTGDARGGGYPGGLVVISGDIDENGDNRLVLIDPSDFTLSPLGVPAGSPN